METRIAVFKGKSIRKTIHNNEWWFSIVDMVEVLTGSARPRKYWNDLKKKLLVRDTAQLSEKIGQLKLPELLMGRDSMKLIAPIRKGSFA